MVIRFLDDRTPWTIRANHGPPPEYYILDQSSKKKFFFFVDAVGKRKVEMNKKKEKK
jgi:hypothetical protein